MSKKDEIETAQTGRGLGLDVVEIARVAGVIDRTPNFCKRVFTDSEVQYCSSKFNPEVHFSTHFAAKEATLKALGLGILSGVALRDVEVAHDKSGKPELVLHNRAKEIFQQQNIKQLLLSITFTSSDAVACVISLYNDKPQHSLIPNKDTVDPAELITKRFKEVRNIV